MMKMAIAGSAWAISAGSTKTAFITLMGRSKDMIISGGFNIYPRDLEEALAGATRRRRCGGDRRAVKAMGRDPARFCCRWKRRVTLDPEALRAATNADLGKTQRLSELRVIAELPRSHIGKILKTELRAFGGNRTAEQKKGPRCRRPDLLVNIEYLTVECRAVACDFRRFSRRRAKPRPARARAKQAEHARCRNRRSARRTTGGPGIFGVTAFAVESHRSDPI